MSTCGPHCNGCSSCPLPDGGRPASDRPSVNGIVRYPHIEALIGLPPPPITESSILYDKRQRAEKDRQLVKIEAERHQALENRKRAMDIVTVGHVGIVAAITAVICPPALLLTVPAMLALDGVWSLGGTKEINAKYDEKAKEYK